MSEFYIDDAMSGSYCGNSREGDFGIELRVDVDGPPASQRISADVFDMTTEPKTYRGSLLVVEPDCAEDEHGMTFAGRGSFTSSTVTPWIEVWIPRGGTETTRRATLSRFDDRDGELGPVYECEFESRYLRRVKLTEDYQEGVDPVDLYDFTARGKDETGRELTIASAYDQAGIDLRLTGERAVIKTMAAGENRSWSDAELHAVMVDRLGELTAPEWAVWLLHAYTHDRDLDSNGSRKTYGILFDRLDDRQRHGCAVFYRWLEGTKPENRRDQLYTCVHEIAHAFNLKHCWSESIVGNARPDALSWLNYPNSYPGGQKEFWSAFEFGFDAPELKHLRHAYYNDIIPGGAPFAPPRSVRNSGLRLDVYAPRELQYGAPVTVGLELMATGTEPQSVPPVFGPRAGNVDIAIRPPNGTEFVFEPLVHHCRADEPEVRRATGDYAFVHYGKDGFAFKEPGVYGLRARYVAPDGSVVLSEAVRTVVRAPLSQADRDVQTLLYDENDGKQGILMSLMGSSARTLATADENLQKFIERYPSHPAAAVARLVRGTNAAREFKTIAPDGIVRLHKRDESAARTLLDDVLDVDRLRRVASDAVDDAAMSVASPEETRVRAVSDELAHMRTKRNVPASVDAFINSRRHEIAAEIARLS